MLFSKRDNTALIKEFGVHAIARRGLLSEFRFEGIFDYQQNDYEVEGRHKIKNREALLTITIDDAAHINDGDIVTIASRNWRVSSRDHNIDQSDNVQLELKIAP